MRIFVKVKSNAKKPSMEFLGEGTYVVAVKEPAIEGKANEAVVKAVAAHFKVARSRVRLISGISSKSKVLEVDSGK